MAVTTTATNLAKCKNLVGKTKTKSLDIKEYLKIPPAVNNRNSRRRAAKEYKKFINPAIPHYFVHLAEFEGKWYNHDSNTRSFIWMQSLKGIAPYNRVPVPKKIQACIGVYEDKESMEADYYKYDNQGSVESKTDKLYGLARIAEIHTHLKYFGDLNGFSGLPSALKHIIWNCQQQKVCDGDKGLVQVFNYFRHEWKILDDIIISYIDNNDYLDIMTSSVKKDSVPVGTFNLFTSDGKAVVVAGCLALLKKYNGTKHLKKAKTAIANLLANTEPNLYNKSSIKGKASEPLDLLAHEFSKGDDLPLHWPSKHVPSGGVGKNPNHEATHQHSDRCAYVLFLLEAEMFNAKVNPRKLFTKRKTVDEEYPPNKVAKSEKLQKEAAKYEKLLDKTAGWNCKTLQLSTYGFCLSDKPSEIALSIYEKK